jgi:hypothetical protein
VTSYTLTYIYFIHSEKGIIALLGDSPEKKLIGFNLIGFERER